MLSARPWNLELFVRLLMGILFSICLSILIGAALDHFLGKERMVEGSLVFLLVGSLLHFAILAATAIFLKRHHIHWAEAFGFHRPLVLAILLGILTCIVFLPVGMILQEISLRALDRFHLPAPTQEAVAQLQQTNSILGRAYFVFFAVVVAPFAEEVLFRGVLYAGVRQLGFRRVALWGSAVVFAVMHLNLSVLLPLLVFGVALAWLYEKTDNLLSTIAAHALFNGINILELFYGEQLKDFLNHLFSHSK